MSANRDMLGEQDVIGLMRAAGRGGPGAAQGDIEDALAAGRRIRSRRRGLQLVGSGSVAGLAAVAVFALGTGSDAGPFVVQSADAAVAAGGGPGPKGPVPSAWGNSVNTQLLLDALGPDFRKGEKGAQGQVVLAAGSPAAEQLPTGYQVAARLMVLDPQADFTLADACKPSVEKGTHAPACSPRTLDDGRVVQVQPHRMKLGEYQPAPPRQPRAAWDSTMFYFERSDRSFVRIEFAVFDSREASSVDRQKVAVAWLDGYIDALADVVADPRVQPAASGSAEPAAPAPSADAQHVREQGILRDALGSSFSLLNGKVTLEPGSAKDAELPRPGFYSGSAEIGTVTGSALDAACASRAGFAGCEKRTLPDGSAVYVLTWADRDATAGELRGESAVYLHQPDGDIVLASLTVTGREATAAAAEAERSSVRAWFDSLEAALISAATDERITEPAGSDG